MKEEADPFKNVCSFDGSKTTAQRDFRSVDAVLALLYTYLYLIRVEIICSYYLISKLYLDFRLQVVYVCD